MNEPDIARIERYANDPVADEWHQVLAAVEPEPVTVQPVHPLAAYLVVGVLLASCVFTIIGFVWTVVAIVRWAL